MTSRDWTIILLVILGVVVLLPVLGMSFWGGGMMGPGMMGPGMMGGWGPGGGFLGGGFGLLFLLLIVAGVVFVVFGLTRKDSRGTAPDEPLQILRARLARGEITKEQFEELKGALK